ncbi:unnamed protein product [Cuscuta epithymum]|uniref:Uncharacterized protein n=1 Tax=Cuscuta epithymum TaxID=186058 RepID=A0AAV0EUQ4_9ASTE|nr:unnamed protein product [Cuscuta epithymum]
MATTLVSESRCMNGGDEFDGVDFSQIDGCALLLMSLLDDTPGVVEDFDDERLKGVIQSLEAEIVNVDGNGLFEGGQRRTVSKASQPSDAGQFGGQDFSELNGLDFSWVGMVDIEMEPLFPTQVDGINISDLEQYCEYDQMDGVDEEEYCDNGFKFEEICSYYDYLW